MSQQDLVQSYVKGAISRRIFIRRLAATGISLSAAMAYSQLLTPEWAAAAEPANDLYTADLKQPATDQQRVGTQTDGPPPTPKAPPPAFAAGVTVSRASLAAFVLTGNLLVLVDSNYPGDAAVKAVLAPAGKGSKRPITIASTTAKIPAPVKGQKVTLKGSRKGLATMRKRGGKLTITTVVKSAGNAPFTKVTTHTVRGKRPKRR